MSCSIKIDKPLFLKITIMGLIREPKNVDFYVIDKPWTDKERKEFSEFIKQRKEQLKKSELRKQLLSHGERSKLFNKTLHPLQ